MLGEFYLDQILQNLLPPSSYSLQYKLDEGLIVDAVIFLDDKLLPIDSKFSLENYNRLVNAKTADRPALEKALKKILKTNRRNVEVYSAEEENHGAGLDVHPERGDIYEPTR